MSRALPDSYQIVSAKEALDRPCYELHLVDTIIPFTYTSIMDGHDNAKLSTLSTMAIDAAVQLAEVHKDAQIVIASEHTFGPDQPSTGQLMKEFAQGNGLESGRIELATNDHEAHDNTPQQVAALKQTLELHSLGSNVLAVGFDYHNQRIIRHARARQLALNAVSVQDVLEETGKNWQYPPSEALEELRRHERLPAMISRFNPSGTILEAISVIFGPQIHDVVPDNESKSGYRTVTGWTRWPLSLFNTSH